MTDKEQKPLKIRVLNSICASVLLVAIVYVTFAGFEAIAVGAMLVALAGAATPVVMSGDGILEMLVGIVEAIVEGVLTIVEGITSAISSLFS